MAVYSNCQVCGLAARHSKTVCLNNLRREVGRIPELEAGLSGAQAENRELLAHNARLRAERDTLKYRLETVYTGSAGTGESLTV